VIWDNYPPFPSFCFMRNFYPQRWLRSTIAIGLGSLTAISCQKESELLTPSANADSFAVTAKQARTAAENIDLSAEIIVQRQHNQATGDTQRVFQGHQRVLNMTPIPTTDGQPGMYICNYAQGGYAIIAADRRLRPILAFSEHGVLPAHKVLTQQDLPDGLLSWLANIKEIAVDLRRNSAVNTPTPDAIAGWRDMVDAPTLPPATPNSIPQASKSSSASTPSFRAPDETGTPPPSSSTQRGPLLQTTWGQGRGYNDFTPAGSLAYNNYHCPTGCVATAMAQVMYYWRYPANAFYWAGMQPSYGTPPTAQLMSACGQAVETDYHDDRGSAYDYKVADKLKTLFGYGSADFISNQDPSLYNNVKNDINNNRPVLLGGFSDTTFGFGSGSGHSWVCDGYIQSYIEGNGYLSFHMNWGWSGDYNSWYAYNNWSIRLNDGSVRQYNSAKTYTINIHP
jgi:hypothetical protein